jgi:hypothetical protein
MCLACDTPATQCALAYNVTVVSVEGVARPGAVLGPTAVSNGGSVGLDGQPLPPRVLEVALPPGQHRDVVTVVAWGLASPGYPAVPNELTLTWTLDTVAPRTQWLVGPRAGTVYPSPTVQLAFDCLDSESPCYFEYSLDGAPPVVLGAVNGTGSGSEAGAGGSGAGGSGAGAEAGAGAVGPGSTVDTLLILVPLAWVGSQEPLQGRPLIKFFQTRDVGVVVGVVDGATGAVVTPSPASNSTVLVRLDGGAEWRDARDLVGSDGVVSLVGLVEGAHSLTAKAVGMGSSTDSTPATVDFVVDVTPPVVRVVAGPGNGSTPSTTAELVLASSEDPATSYTLFSFRRWVADHWRLGGGVSFAIWSPCAVWRLGSVSRVRGWGGFFPSPRHMHVPRMHARSPFPTATHLQHRLACRPTMHGAAPLLSPLSAWLDWSREWRWCGCSVRAVLPPPLPSPSQLPLFFPLGLAPPSATHSPALYPTGWMPLPLSQVVEAVGVDAAGNASPIVRWVWATAPCPSPTSVPGFVEGAFAAAVLASGVALAWGGVSPAAAPYGFEFRIDGGLWVPTSASYVVVQRGTQVGGWGVVHTPFL